ncbi:hypothetical protein KR018_001131 [Drosophila ironensis]|nr:hypothetical protein KR018_001131 [Drosophila ironensis]
MPMSPMHYMASPRGYIDPGLGLSPGGGMPPQAMLHPSHHSPINRLMVPGRYDPRYSGYGVAQPRNPSPRDYQTSPVASIPPSQRNANPPSFSNPHKGGYLLPGGQDALFHMGAGHPWDHGYPHSHPHQQNPPPPPPPQQQQQQQQQQPSSKPNPNANPSRPLSILAATADTSFFEKKPPNSVNMDLDVDVTDVDALSRFPRRSNNSSHNNNNNNSSAHNNNNNNSHGSSLLFWNNSNKESSNFVRSDSILDDDATTFDMPTGTSMHSPYGPICPKSSTTSGWNNWLLGNDMKSAAEFLGDKHSDLGYGGYKGDNFNANKPPMWGRKPQLMSEDSFEGGIDSGMMLQLEKNLVDIVDPDDSGIKVD